MSSRICIIIHVKTTKRIRYRPPYSILNTNLFKIGPFSHHGDTHPGTLRMSAPLGEVGGQGSSEGEGRGRESISFQSGFQAVGWQGAGSRHGACMRI